MHIFSGLVHFGQLCSGGCKSAARPAVMLLSRQRLSSIAGMT
jgi:hypothetical protein